MIEAHQFAKNPEAVGIDPRRLKTLFDRVRLDVDVGNLPSAQVAIAREGKVAGLLTYGTIKANGEERSAENDVLYCAFSCTKSVVALAIWILWEEGRLDLDEAVADIVPHFGKNGKEKVKVEHLLLHTCGFPNAPYHPKDWADPSNRQEVFSKWRCEWEPDSRFEYHATSGFWVLAEIIRIRSGLDHRDFIRERITEPMGLNELSVGLPEIYDHRVAQIQFVGEPVEPPGGIGGVPLTGLLVFNQPSSRRAGVPGGGGIASAAEFALFFQALINGGRSPEGRQIVQPETIAFGTQVRSREHHRDPVSGIPVNRAVGVVVAGDDGNAHIRGFGDRCSTRAFGHGGAAGQIAWADPESGISLSYLTNGLAPWTQTGNRSREISTLAAECAL